MKYCITIERDENGFFIIKVPAMPECVSEGKTSEEALETSEKATTEYTKNLAEFRPLRLKAMNMAHLSTSEKIRLNRV